jgi:membrane-bound lytic murein transglycosylase D
MLTPPDAPFDLQLPAGTAALFNERVAMIPPSKRNSWRYHRVAAGDTLASVAREFRVPLAEVASANQMREGDDLESVEAVVVPVPPAPALSTRMMLYTARRGDTLVTIADRFGVSLSQLRRWNKMTGTKVEQGRRLRVAEPSLAPRAAHKHRRGAASAGAKAQEAQPAKSGGARAATTGPQKKTGAAPAKNAVPQSTRTAAGQKKSGKQRSKSIHAQHSATHPKAAASKQK